jgi:hypothetical protein
MVNATVSAKMKIPDFSGMFFGAIKDGLYQLWKKIPYTDQINGLYLAFAIAGIVLVIILVWFWYNFLR